MSGMGPDYLPCAAGCRSCGENSEHCQHDGHTSGNGGKDEGGNLLPGALGRHGVVSIQCLIGERADSYCH